MFTVGVNFSVHFLRWDLTTPLSPHPPTMQMLLESIFFCTQQVVMKRRGAAAIAARVPQKPVAYSFLTNKYGTTSSQTSRPATTS